MTSAYKTRVRDAGGHLVNCVIESVLLCQSAQEIRSLLYERSYCRGQGRQMHHGKDKRRGAYVRQNQYCKFLLDLFQVWTSWDLISFGFIFCWVCSFRQKWLHPVAMRSRLAYFNLLPYTRIQRHQFDFFSVPHNNCYLRN